jgi:Ca2+-transporting ATPase
MELKLRDTAVHSLLPEEVVRAYQTDAAAGLSRSEAGSRLDEFGRNEIPTAPPPHPLRLLLRQFRSLLVIILLLAAILNLVFWLLEGDQDLPYDTVVIMAIVIANSALGFFQEYRAEKSLQKLNALTSPRATVMRDSRLMEIDGSELVPGDILVLGTGDSVLADSRLVTASSLEVNESTLTGESAVVLKSTELVEADAPLADRTGMVYAGTQVSAGKGRAVVTATGADTEMGQIAELIIAAPRLDTPMQQQLEKLGKALGLIIVLVAVAVSVSGLLISRPLSTETALNLILFGVALAVAAIPEGLTAVVTGSLALGTQRMARRHAIVRKLHSVEVLGSTSAICSDKTGTLTAGEMMVREIDVHSGRVTISGKGYSPVGGEATGTAPAIEEATALAMSAVICNDSSIIEDENGKWRPVGTPTEAALVTLAVRLGLDFAFLRSQNQRVAEEPFSSERKRMSVVVSAGGGGAMLHTKGAPEIVIPLCSHISTADGMIAMTDTERQRLLEQANGMASKGLRSLAVARRQVEAGACANPTSCETDLVFLGFAGLADPPRPEAAAAIKECYGAGIQVFMITGDHLSTAQAIASELGITGGAMTGPEIEKTSDEELARLIVDKRIFARVSPGHKVRIVMALKANGHIVTVTGDGVNDAPALKRADIGVAMGQTGTDVAREAADMVLADDNFATIVAAVEEGRAIFTNIRKFLGFLLSSNTGLVLTLFLGVIFAKQLGLTSDGRILLPLLAVQILWINLVTNGPPALALGVEPKSPEAMRQLPRPREEPVVNGEILQYIILVGLVAGIGGIIILGGYYPGGFFTIREHAGIEYPRTMTFVTLTLFQLFASLNFRDLRASVLPRLFGNPWLFAALAVSSAMMVAVVHIPALQTAFHTVPLMLSDWLIAVAVASSVLWAVELYKALRRWMSG